MARIPGTVANEVPGDDGPAKNDDGPMSENPTNAMRSPSRVTTCGRRAASSVAPAPTGTAPEDRTARTVSSSAGIP